MLIFKKAADIKDYLGKKNREKTGFVPTMGALHEGHLSLIEACRRDCDIVVVSIFVNPTQFNDPRDFEKYPVTTAKDVHLLTRAGVDLLFLPDVGEVYPEGLDNSYSYDLGGLDTRLEGRSRPGHFQGVSRVMHRLLGIIDPRHLYMGQKDYQQCMVVARLIDILQMRVTLHVCPTLRDMGGLALSSRNMRLTDEERLRARAIYAALRSICEEIHAGDTGDIIARAVGMIEDASMRVDYLTLADAKDLTEVRTWDGKQELVALAAAFMGEVRLIDNLVLSTRN